MAEKIKFTDSEIEEINNLRIEVGKVFTEMGSLQIEKRKQIAEFEQLENSLLQKHSDLAVKEEILFKGLNEKYGDGDYNPNTGEFTPAIEQ
jgi:hypothetical protein